jgi:type III secretion protein Q
MSDPIDSAAAVPAARPLNLGQLATQRVAADFGRLSRILQAGCEATVMIAGTPADISLQLDEGPAEWAGNVLLGGPFGEIECVDGHRLLRALTGIDPEAAGTGKDMVAWLQSAIIGRLGNSPFAAVDSLRRTDGMADGRGTVVRITLRGENHALSTHARAAASVWLAFLDDGRWTRRQAPSARFDDLMIASTVRVASHTLPAHALRGLAEGDIVVPDQPAFDSTGTGRVRLGCVHAQVRHEAPNSLYILSTEALLDAYDMNDEALDDDFDGADDDAEYGADNEEHEHSEYEDHNRDYGEEDGDEPGYTDEDTHAGDDREAPPATAKATGNGDIDSIPVTLAFELGSVRMSLADVRSLARGSIVTIEGGGPQSIAIVSGSRKIGQGEIVDVEGRLGIRITHWRT